MNYHYFTQLYTTLHSFPLWIYHLQLLLVVYLLLMGNPISKEQIPRRSFYGCGFQQFITSLQALWLLYWVFSKRWLSFVGPAIGFCLHVFRSVFQAHAWQDEVIYCRPISRPGIRSLVFQSQLCPLLVVWILSTYILLLTFTPCHAEKVCNNNTLSSKI